MAPEERQMLAELADKIAGTPAPAHDAEADEFIRTNIGKRPDALYILTQTTLIQNLAIQHAQQEIQDLRQRLAQPAAAQPTSRFLGGGPQEARPASVSGSSPWPSPPPMSPSIPQSAPPAAEPPSFLRSAAQTAAGVAAGAFAFEGIRALFGGGGFGGWGGPHLGGLGGGSFLGGAPNGETITNNYHDTPAARDTQERTERNDRSSDDSSSNDAEASATSDDVDDSSDSDDSSSDGDTYADDAGYDDGGGSGSDDFA